MSRDGRGQLVQDRPLWIMADRADIKTIVLHRPQIQRKYTPTYRADAYSEFRDNWRKALSEADQTQLRGLVMHAGPLFSTELDTILISRPQTAALHQKHRCRWWSDRPRGMSGRKAPVPFRERVRRPDRYQSA